MNSLNDVRDGPMSPFQVRSVAVAVMLLVMDGFDLTVIAFAAPEISREWGLSGTELGLVLSATLLGMGAGSILLAPLADKFGRRSLIITAQAVMALGMLLTVFSVGIYDLMIYRIITGLGGGAMISNIIVIVNEYSSLKRRSTLTALQAAGYPVGATIAGLSALALIPEYGWRSVFIVGAIVNIALLLICIRGLPESLDFLLIRRTAKNFERTNYILERMGRQRILDWPTDDLREHRTSVSELLTSSVLIKSILLWIGYAFLIASFYFVNSWTPEIVASASGDPSSGTMFGIAINLGGIVGCLVIAGIMIKYNPGPVLTITLLAAALSFAAFSALFDHFAAALTVAILLGLLVTAGVGGLQAFAPHVYSPRAKATGIGFMIGAGRVVSIVAPLIVGVLLDAGIGANQIYLVFSVPLLITATCVLIIHTLQKREQNTHVREDVS